jgi:predicted ATPase
MLHLKSIHLKQPLPSSLNVYPFNLPVIRSLPDLEFSSPVTFLVGENGSGKSSLLEAVACAANSIVAGSESVGADKTLAAGRHLAQHLRLAWHKRTRKGFFLRAEDFFGYAKRLAQMRAELEDDLRGLEAEYQGRSPTALGLAQMPFHRELHDLQQRYGGDLNARSHGESFLTFFQSRFVPGGLYLLDEPEAPLSPLRQLALLALLKEMVAQDAQFIIATHSPILMAFPGALLLSFDQVPLKAIPYEALEHVRVTRDFLNRPEQFLQHL